MLILLSTSVAGKNLLCAMPSAEGLRLQHLPKNTRSKKHTSLPHHARNGEAARQQCHHEGDTHGQNRTDQNHLRTPPQQEKCTVCGRTVATREEYKKHEMMKLHDTKIVPLPLATSWDTCQDAPDFKCSTSKEDGD